jgi:predicted NBD/HSP70 family sugar kinase
LIGIGIGIPGVLDRNTGRIILVPFAEEWTKYNLLEGMKSRFTCPVCFENSVNLGALGEKWRGCGVPFHNIFYINYSIGIGSALIINDELFTGSNGVAGEIGYSIPSPSHIRTNFKEEGVLEELISGKALDERIKSLNLGLNSLKELFESKSEVFENLRQDILAKVKDLFFVILLASISVINPSVVILSGRIGINLGKLLKEDWEKALNAHFRFPPKLLISEQGSMANVYGAVRLALSHIDDELSAS